MKIKLANNITLAEIPDNLTRKIRDTFTLENPVWLNNNKINRWNGKKTIGQKITVGIVNSIYPIADDIKRFFGHVVVDECHRCPSRTFTEAVTAFDPKYMLGLSATPWRRDGLMKLIGWYLGPQVKIEPSELTDRDIVLDVDVVTRQTGFVPLSQPDRRIQCDALRTLRGPTAQRYDRG